MWNITSGLIIKENYFKPTRSNYTQRKTQNNPYSMNFYLGLSTLRIIEIIIQRTVRLSKGWFNKWGDFSHKRRNTNYQTIIIIIMTIIFIALSFKSFQRAYLSPLGLSPWIVYTQVTGQNFTCKKSPFISLETATSVNSFPEILSVYFKLGFNYWRF